MSTLIKTFWKHAEAERDGDAIIIGGRTPDSRRRVSLRTLITGLSVLAAMVAALGTLWQARLTRQALEITNQQVALSRQQFEVQKQQFQDQLLEARREAKQQAATTDTQLQLTKDAVKAMRDNAQSSLESARSARESSNFAQTSFQTSHRAYMIMESASFQSQPAAKQPWTLTVNFRNIGLTPALQVNAAWSVRYLANGSKIEPLPRIPVVQLGNTNIGPI